MSEKKIDDGGAAFPCKHSDFSPADHGMTLRDWFAGKSMSDTEYELIKRGFFVEHPDRDHVSLFELRYWHADRMIAEKRRTEGGGK